MTDQEVRSRQRRELSEQVGHEELGRRLPESNSVIDLEPEGHGCCGWFLIILAVIGSIILFPVTIWLAFRTLKTYERGVVLRLGKLTRSRSNPIRGSGVVCLIPFVDKLLRVDTRTRTVDINPQEVLTRDSVTVKVDAVVYMHVFDTALALLRVENWSVSAELLAVSMVRKVLGKYKLSDLLTARDEIDQVLCNLMDQATSGWGIKVERVEITDVVLPQDLQRAMAAEAEESRGAKAKVIAAQGELDSSKMLREAADQLSLSPVAIQLRLMQTLASIATEQNSTIVFPFPVEFFKLMGGQGRS